MWVVSVTGDDYIPPLYVGCECHLGLIIYLHYMWGVSVTGGWLYTSTICGVWVSLRVDYIPPLYVGSGCHWGWLYTSTICGEWVSLGMIIYLHYMWGVGVTGDDYIPPLYVGSGCHWGWLYTSTICGVWVSLRVDYIPPLYVGSECHWGMIIYLHYMWGVSVT